MLTNVPTFKLILLGDGGVGKTTFVKRHRTGEFETNHIPTIGVEVHRLTFITGKGPICFDIWDTAGCEKFKDLLSAYYHKGDCAIVMFDVSDKVTWRNVPNWCRDILSTPNVRICMCGNKVDREDERMVKAVTAMRFAKKKKIEYFDISAKTNYNFEKPFLYFARLLLKDPNIEFSLCPELFPPEIILSSRKMKQLETQMEEARNQSGKDILDDDV